MKKFLMILCYVIIIVLVFSGCNTGALGQIENITGISFKNIKVYNLYDTTGGVYGDGIMRALISFKSQDDCENVLLQIQENSNWNELPVKNSSLKSFLFDTETHTGRLSKNGVNQVENGYYFFTPRNVDNPTAYDHLNYTIISYACALYDTDTNTFYFLGEWE